MDTHAAYCKHSYRKSASILSIPSRKISYMNTPGQKIKAERELKGWSQQRLADEIAKIKGETISRAAIAQWEAGSSKSQKPENFFAAAKALGLNPYWVLDGSGDKHLSPSSDTQPPAKSAELSTPKIPHEDDYALIPQFHVNGSCGDGYMNDHVEIRGGLAFKRDWLARMNIDPAQASVIYARGDSMAPTLNDGEVMLIDNRTRDPQSGKVYVIEVGGDLRAKRLFNRATGWVIASDNQDKMRYPDEPLHSLGDIRVLGRVVWRGGGM